MHLGNFLNSWTQVSTHVCLGVLWLTYHGQLQTFIYQLITTILDAAALNCCGAFSMGTGVIVGTVCVGFGLCIVLIGDSC